MTDTMTATKTCKQCGEALPLTAFGTKQARCKQCINNLRAGKTTLFDAQILSMVTAPMATVKDTLNTAVKDMSADEKLEYTLARAEDTQKSCAEGHLMVGDNVSKAYARRGALRCRDCVNAESRANKAKNRKA